MVRNDKRHSEFKFILIETYGRIGLDAGETLWRAHAAAQISNDSTR